LILQFFSCRDEPQITEIVETGAHLYSDL
jgi:hypothetical protein